MGRNKVLRKKISGELRVISEHYQKIQEEYEKSYPDQQLIAKWERDIEIHLRILAKLREALPGGRA